MQVQVDLQKFKHGLASKKDIIEAFHDVEFLIEEIGEQCNDETQAFKEDVQGQLQDIFSELKSLRRELIYSQSRLNESRKKKA